MTSPFFTIIIPAFNSANCIVDSIKSINGQSFQDYELIVMDGGSTDGTQKIISETVSDISKLVLISERDNGIYDAMNKALNIAKGEWIYFLGSDDILISNDVLEFVKVAVQNNPSDLLYGNILRKSDKIRFGGPFDLKRLLTRHNLCHQSVFYRRSIFDKVGNYNLKYKVWADWDLNIRCFQHPGLKFLYVDKDIALYNNVSGLSSLEEDSVFKEYLPKYYMQQLDAIKHSFAYRVVNRIFGFSTKK